jgi:phosphoenolpyruvate-protein phosphotransferase (PTS system enzyme I)
MNRSELPDEEFQFQSYKSVLEQLKGRYVVFRTLDIGGDKALPYLELPQEENPFLGYRAIRLSLENTKVFRIQLRSLLRASVFGDLKIMFPMIATLDEFRAAKQLLVDEKSKLLDEGIPVAKDIEVGMMVEIPSAVLLAEQFAKEVDFFSIGTNDLIQYTMAADRMNERVTYLYQPFNPSILKMIKLVIDAAHKEGKWVGMCGEMASHKFAVPLLIGLGLDEFSMGAPSILEIRSLLREIVSSEWKEYTEHALTLCTEDEVIEFIKSKLPSTYHPTL